MSAELIVDVLVVAPGLPLLLVVLDVVLDVVMTGDAPVPVVVVEIARFCLDGNFLSQKSFAPGTRAIGARTS